jgi:hypothetical protein
MTMPAVETLPLKTPSCENVAASMPGGELILSSRPVFTDRRGPHRGRGGGRTWWAHFEFTRINITPTILRKKIEDLRDLGASMSQFLRRVITRGHPLWTGSKCCGRSVTAQ